MSSLHFIRLVSRAQSTNILRSKLIPRRMPIITGTPVIGCISGFSTSMKQKSGGSDYDEETFEEFTARYEEVTPTHAFSFY